MPARPAGEPVADQRGLVGGVVVHDEMDIEIIRHIGLDRVEKFAEFGGAMAREALADYPAGGDVERGEQRGGAVAGIVMAAPRRLAAPPGRGAWRGRLAGAPGRGAWPGWLAAVERLDLRLLVDAQHKGFGTRALVGG